MRSVHEPRSVGTWYTCGIHLDHRLTGKSYEGNGLYRVKKEQYSAVAPSMGQAESRFTIRLLDLPFLVSSGMRAKRFMGTCLCDGFFHLLRQRGTELS